DAGGAHDDREGGRVMFAEAASAGEEELVDGVIPVEAGWCQRVMERFGAKVRERPIDDGAVFRRRRAPGAPECAAARIRVGQPQGAFALPGREGAGAVVRVRSHAVAGEGADRAFRDEV